MMIKNSRLLIIPLGEAGQSLLAGLAASLARVFGMEAGVGEQLPIPGAAWSRRRRQHSSGKVLTVLARIASASSGPRPVLLGVTGVDLFTPGLNFVFGEADPRGRVAVISLARLDSAQAGAPGGSGLLHERALKEAVHELGHVFGLAHCGDPGCIMHFSNSVRDTDRKGPGFCPGCLAELTPGGSVSSPDAQ